MWCEDHSDQEGLPDKAFVQENQNQRPEQTSHFHLHFSWDDPFRLRGPS